MTSILFNGSCLIHSASGIANDLRSMIKTALSASNFQVSLIAQSRHPSLPTISLSNNFFSQLVHSQYELCGGMLGVNAILVPYHLLKKHSLVEASPSLVQPWMNEMFDKYHCSIKKEDLKIYFTQYKYYYQYFKNIKLETRGFDAYISYNFENVTISKQTKHIVRVHDLVPLFYPTTVNRPRLSAKLYLRALKKSKADLFLANSATTADELRSAGISSDRISIRYCFPDDIYKQNRKINKEKFGIIWVSTIEKRKNLETFISALELHIERHEKIDAPVFIVGNQGWGYTKDERQSLLKRIKKLKLKININLYSGVTSHQLCELYDKSRIFVSTSIWEGFNLPAAEAALRGCNLILSDIAVHREVYNKKAEFFKASDVSLLSDLINKKLNEKFVPLNIGNINNLESDRQWLQF